MKRILVRVLAAIGAVTVGFLLLGILGMSLLFRHVTGDGIPAEAVLELNLEQGLVEYVPDDPMAGVFSRRASTVQTSTKPSMPLRLGLDHCPDIFTPMCASRSFTL